MSPIRTAGPRRRWSARRPEAGSSQAFHGELIARVYDELVANPRVFAKALLSIVYDEHGGFYDHVVLPCDAIASSGSSKEGFDFTRVGVRVPAVVI